MENQKTNIRKFFEAVANKNKLEAKILIDGVKEELEYLEREDVDLNPSGVTCISDINQIIENVKTGQIDIAWGKNNFALQAAYSGHLENHLKV